MQDAFIVSALRTPIGKKKGSLSELHPADLGAIVLSETFKKIDLDPNLVEDVIYGCVDTVGPQAGILRELAGWQLDCQSMSQEQRLIGNVDPLSKQFISLLKQ